MRKIVLTTVGTFGDLHPFIAIALALQNRGYTPLLAVSSDQVAKCRQAGLKAVAILPGFAKIQQRMGLTHEAAVRRVIGNQRVMFEQTLLPDLSESAAELDVVSSDAVAIVASNFVIAAPIIAEKRNIPLISVILQPMAILSDYDPPRTPDFWMMSHRGGGRIGVRWNHLVYASMRSILNRLYGQKIDEVRTEHGLPHTGARKLFDLPELAMLRLCCYSSQLGTLPADAGPKTRIVGFPVFDSYSGHQECLPQELETFLAAGAPPVVFTLGTFAVSGAERFYALAAKAARRSGTRAVLLTGGNAPVSEYGNVLSCGYAPHSLLFPRAAAVVHHGGVGTTGQALRAGKPQLIVPHMGDQNDHARRIVQMGAGLMVGRRGFTSRSAAKLIRLLLDQPPYRSTALRIAEAMHHENGAEAAADMIVSALTVRHQSPS